MTDTGYRQKAGTSEWAISLFRHNGHDAYSQMRALDSVADLEEAQAAATAELQRLAIAETFAGAGAHWWARLEHGTWHPTIYDVEGEPVCSAIWQADGPQHVGSLDGAGAAIWKAL